MMKVANLAAGRAIKLMTLWSVVSLLLFLMQLFPAFGKDCNRTSMGFIPLIDLGTGLYLSQFEGGLYPDGATLPTGAHLANGLAAASRVVPRDVVGRPALEGKAVLLAIGMSNTTEEWCHLGSADGCAAETFQGQAWLASGRNHDWLVLVNGAQSGQTAAAWAQPTHRVYELITRRLAAKGLTPAQVQIAWVKVATPGPKRSLPDSTADVYVLGAYLRKIVVALRDHYPHVQQIFFSSRIYAGYADPVLNPLNPEPYAYESGFAVKWLIEEQIAREENGWPWLGWAAYLWADGLVPRADGLTYTCAEFGPDGTHPGRVVFGKVGKMLLDFFLTSPVTPWFRAQP